MRIYAGQNMKDAPAAPLPSEVANTKRIKSIALQQISQPQLSTASDKNKQEGERLISTEICLMTKTCSMKIRKGKLCLCFYGSYVLHSTVREAGISNSQQG